MAHALLIRSILGGSSLPLRLITLATIWILPRLAARTCPAQFASTGSACVPVRGLVPVLAGRVDRQSAFACLSHLDSDLSLTYVSAFRKSHQVQRKVKQDHKMPIRNVFYGEKSSIAPKSNPKLIPLAIGPCINFLGTFGGLQSAQQCVMNAAEILAFTTQALPAWRTSPYI